MSRIVSTLFSLTFAAYSVVAIAQMGNPANGPTKIPDNQIDPARNLTSATLESVLHKPLPEQYIWTKEDAVPDRQRIAQGWGLASDADLAPHYFRRTFKLEAVPVHATLYLAGPRKATIYLNGKEVGSYDLNLDFPIGIRVYACSVAGVLRKGMNVIAVEAVRGPQHGADGPSRLSAQQDYGEVLAAMILPAARGVVADPLVMSDAKWKATTLSVPSGWQDPGFDDSNWPLVDDLSGIEGSISFFQWNSDAGMYAWPGYDGISPFLAHYTLRPVKVSNVYSGIGTIKNAQSLTAKNGVGELTVTLPDDHVSRYNAPQILLDFGREITGRIELQSDSNQPAQVTVQYGESEAEAFMQPYLGVDPVYLPPMGTAYGPKSAFRYAIIRFTGGRDTRFRSIRLDGIAYPVKYEGSFESSDPQLNKMWAIGAYTAHLCMQDDIWDAPKRDRGRWMGDLDVSGRTIGDVFGDHLLMQDTLNRLIGPAPVVSHVNGIPGYSAFWVIGEKQFYLRTGSMQQLESMHTRLIQLLDYMETDLNQNGLFVDATHAWPFVDWSPGMSSNDEQTRMANQFEYYAAFQDGAWLLRVLHDSKNAANIEQEANKLKMAAQRYMLDAKGSFGDRWQPNAYAVLSGIANKNQYVAIWNNSLSSVGQNAHPHYIITPYYNFYVVSAMARMGHEQAALDWIRQYWGGMLQEGATSFWEGYDPSWYKGYLFHAALQADNQSGFHTSLAHGWSSGVTPWIMAHILGIQPMAGGFSKVDIRPDLIGLKWAKGTEPTPHGLLGVAIRNSDGYVTTINLPIDVQARVSVPVPSTSSHVYVNGKTQHSMPAESGTRAVVILQGQGTYVINAH